MTRQRTTKTLEKILVKNGYEKVVKKQPHCIYYAWVKDGELIISTGDNRLAALFAIDHLEDYAEYCNRWGWKRAKVSDIAWLNK